MPIDTPSRQLTATGAPRPGGAGALADHVVSRIGFGAMQLERLRGDRDAAPALLRRAVELGVDHIDTGGPIPLRPAQRPEQLRASVEDNLRSLGMDQIPLRHARGS